MWTKAALSVFICSLLITPSSCFRAHFGLFPRKSRFSSASTRPMRINAMLDQFDAVSKRMPIESRQLLIQNVDPSTVVAEDLLKSSIRGKEQYDEAMVGWARSGGVQTVPCLNNAECKALRDYVDECTMRWHGPSAKEGLAWTTRIDSVDHCPDFQINLFPSDLARIVGEEGFKKMWNLPLALSDSPQASREPEEHGYKRVGVFLRKYTTDTRPFIPFHVDTNTWTGNVAINGDDEYEGGNLLVVTDKKVHKVARKAGEATIHDNRIAHGVSKMISGTRYSLILFFERDDSK